MYQWIIIAKNFQIVSDDTTTNNYYIHIIVVDAQEKIVRDCLDSNRTKKNCR